jgi:hypothetical protein
MKIDYGWKNESDFRCWGPYCSYGIHAATEIRISWQSKFHALSHWIEYGDTAECKNKREEKISPTNMHTFILKDLKPNTIYYYKISRIEDLQIQPQPIYTIRTGPSEDVPTSFDFCAIADFHACIREGTHETLQSMVRNVPNASFVLSAGDCVTHGGQEEAWNDFFYQVRNFGPKYPIMHTTGNHDTDHPETYAHFVQTFHNPYPNPENGAYYYFIYGNAVFIMLDSTNGGQSSATQGVISDQQMEWLEGVLEQFALKHYWIFVLMHHPVYTTGDSGMIRLYELAYRDLFEHYHVDMVLFGHDHFFEVYCVGKDLEWGGTHYCLIGNAGGDGGVKNMNTIENPPYLWKGRTYIPSRDGILGGNMKGMRYDEIIKSSYVYGIIEKGFTHFHIDGDTLEMKMWGMENQVYYRDHLKRTGCGKKFHHPEYMQEF